MIMVPVVVLSLLLNIVPCLVSGSCPSIVYQEGHPSLPNVTTLSVYLDLSDEEFGAVLQLLIGNDNVSIIRNGEVQMYFSTQDFLGLAPPIPSSIQQIPIHATSGNELYYSLSVVSSNSTITGPFADTTPTQGIIRPGEVEDFTVELCCKQNGTIILEGCLTVGNEPLDLFTGSYQTIGPFYSRYSCQDSYPHNCDDFPTNVFYVIADFCFTQNQTQELRESGGWGILIFADRFCAIDSYNSDGQQPLLNNEASNRALPIPVTFDGVDMYFERTTIFEEQVVYSMMYSVEDASILGQPTTSIPLQGTFNSTIEFFVDLPCLSVGVSIVYVNISYSAFLDGILFDNNFDIFFHRDCTPEGYTEAPSETNGISLLTILSSTIVPIVLVVVVLVVIVVGVVVVTRRHRSRVMQIEELATQKRLQESGNIYSLRSVSDSPLLVLAELNIEYNFVLLEVVDKLGEGYFGNVYKARAPGLQRGEHEAGEFVAVKTLKNNSVQEILVEFVNEVKTCAEFDHDNVVRLLGICTSTQTCMIFEYMDLGSLLDLIRKSDTNNPDYDPQFPYLLNNDQLLHIVLQIARGLSYLSYQNFVHRDIAARNCLVNSQLVVKISDFGLSRNISADNYYRLKADKNNFMPIRWMPPEAILYGKFTLKSDVWSFGVLMWEVYMLGEQPYSSLSNHEVIDCLKASKVLDHPRRCPMGVYNIMHSCWTRIPSKRPTMHQIEQRLHLYSRGKMDALENYVNLVPDLIQQKESLAQD